MAKLPATQKIKSHPYWWDGQPLPQMQELSLSPSCDVAIVGAGYAGLSAALELARAGRSVQVFDKQLAGEGASTRNGGVTSANLRFSPDGLRKKFGETRAHAMMAESAAARQDFYAFLADKNVDCDFRQVGRFTGAICTEHYDSLAREAEYRERELGVKAYAVSQSEQRKYIGTDIYRGGMVQMDIGGLNPAKLHAEVLRLAREAGVVVHQRTPVLDLVDGGRHFTVRTSRGETRARDVILTTNGYTDGLDRWLRRRIVPVRSRMIATEELSPDLMARLMLPLMMYGDTRKLSYYYRPSPDGKRILFGGRDGTIAGDPAAPIEHLRKKLVEVFPELDGAGLSHSWYGYVAMNLGMVPRLFAHHRVHYATSCCGTGIIWQRWTGKRVAQGLIGVEGKSAFDFAPPAAVPLFRGTAWFMPAAFTWMNLQDRMSFRRG